MTLVHRSTAAVPAAAVPASAKAIEFSHFSPTGLTRLRDGGSLVLKGNLNRSVSAQVRLDGGLSSPTRGTFFVASYQWNQKPGADRPATKAELKQLKASLQSFLSRSTLDKPTAQTYGALLRRLDVAMSSSGAPLPMPKYLKLLASTVFNAQGWPADLKAFPAVPTKALPPAVKRAAEAWATREEGNLDGAHRLELGGRTAWVVDLTIPNDAETSWGTFKVFDPHGSALSVKPPK